MKCTQCDWEWIPRVENPKRCPACHAVLQPTERMLERRRERMERRLKMQGLELPVYADQTVHELMCCERCKSKEKLFRYKKQTLCFNCLSKIFVEEES